MEAETGDLRGLLWELLGWWGGIGWPKQSKETLQPDLWSSKNIKKNYKLGAIVPGVVM